MSIKKGIMPAVMTFWNKDESYNEAETLRYVDWVIEQGAQNISCTGSTGENISMTMEEQKKIMKSIIDHVNHRVPVYAGTGRYSTSQTIELSKYAQEVGAEGVLVIMPYYLQPHKRAVVNHFRALRKAIDIDIILYNNPRFCGYEMTPLEIKAMVDEGLVNGVKSAQGDPNRVHELKYYCGDRLTVEYGHDYAPMEGFFAGADGWLSGMPAIFPKFARNLYDICVEEKNIDKAREYWTNIQPFVDYFITYSTNDPHWHEVFKYVLKCLGFDAGLPRMPLGDLEEKEKKKVDALLADLKAKGII
ncbi:dihydrodipicolinate synthase family protein [Caproiciproducens sp. R1]|jgi:4-hydroxy-tetrahydrodipicolinate synthase|uniref:dihydrodipicolinate synthase family protein n=1 Tax=Caproiciproducens sp. R1 TaxID=3435000 RepID=UPI004034930C|nr:dihydrodipicolinate synthase family protein [Oscillospiraceae bacterium]